MRLLIVAAAFSVAACASTSDIQLKPVSARFGSSRSVAEISSCLAGVLSGPSGAIVKTETIAKGVALSESTRVHMASAVSRVTEIEDAGDIRTVTVRSIARFNAADESRVAQAYRPCL